MPSARREPPPLIVSSSAHRRRAPRALLLVIGVAVAAAVVVALVGFRTAPTRLPGIPRGSDLITVTGTPTSRPVAPDFIGLSLEYTAVQAYAGTNPSAVNPVFVKLFDGLAPGGDPVLRIGGDTTDWGWFPVPGLRHPRGIRFTLHGRWVAVTRALAQALHGKLILGLNLEADNPRLIAEEVRRFLGVGQNALAAFELGNEPEVFGALGWYQTAPHHPVFSRPRTYGFSDYSREFSRFSALVPPSIPLAGPSTGGSRFWAKTGEFLRRHPRVKIVTFHLYPLHECLGTAATTPTIRHLLAPPASRGLAALIAPYVPVVHRHGAVLRIDELNSVSCGGGPGVSDRFASALWAADTMFTLAQEGVDGVNFHTFKNAYYRPFTFHHTARGWSATVEPMYYGMLAFNRAAPPGSTLLQTGAPASPDLRVWATRGTDGKVHALLINVSPQRAHTIAIKLPGGGGSGRVTLERLLAPSLKASTGITLGGQSFARPTYSAQLTGHHQLTTLREAEPGVYLLHLPPGSAGILSR